MGNHHMNANKMSELEPSCGACNLCAPARLQLKPTKMDSYSKSDDAFIINYHRKNKINDSIDSLDERRLVFVSLAGLYQSWRRVPSILLYTSLLMMPLKKEWICNPSQYRSELEDNICSACCGAEMNEITDFIRLLQWKTSQGLVLFILDDIEIDVDDFRRKLHRFVPNPLVAPFWYRVNAKLTSLYDHVEGTCYQPLSFDEKYWANHSSFCSKYKTKTKAILGELYFVTMQPNAIQEIMYQSNPKSLHPVIEYGHKYHLNLDPIDVTQCHDTHLVSPLSPIIEQKEHQTQFCFNGISDINPIEINIDGVTPIHNEETMNTPSTYFKMEAPDRIDSYANC